MIEEKDIIEIGKFLKPHALKGELNVVTEYPSVILEENFPLIVDIDGIYVPFYAESVRPKGHFGSLVKIEGVNSAEDARRFVNKQIYMLRSDVAKFLNVDEDELETELTLTGYKVVDKSLGYIGRVVDIDDSTDNILLLVNPDDNDDEIIYIPFADELIDVVIENESPEESVIQMNLPEGMIDLNSKE